MRGGWKNGERDGRARKFFSSKDKRDRFLRWSGGSLLDGRGHWDRGIGSRNKLPVDRPSPPLPFNLPSKIIIRKAINHTEFVKNDFHRARISTGKSCCELGLEI